MDVSAQNNDIRLIGVARGRIAVLALLCGMFGPVLAWAAIDPNRGDSVWGLTPWLAAFLMITPRTLISAELALLSIISFAGFGFAVYGLRTARRDAIDLRSDGLIVHWLSPSLLPWREIMAVRDRAAGAKSNISLHLSPALRTRIDPAKTEQFLDRIVVSFPSGGLTMKHEELVRLISSRVSAAASSVRRLSKTP